MVYDPRQPPGSHYESDVELPPEDPRKEEYRGIAIKTRFIWVIMLTLGCWGLALFNPESMGHGRRRSAVLRLIIETVGWRPFWIGLGAIFFIWFLVAVAEFISRGTNDTLDGIDDHLADE